MPRKEQTERGVKCLLISTVLLIISIITYSSASWTLTKAQKKCLDAFNTKALRRIVGVRWHDFVTNASILIRTGQPPLTTTIRKLRLSAFGHICRLQPGTQAIDILASTPPSTWHRPRGRPPLRWADQIVNDTQLSLSDAVTATQDRHPGDRSFVMLRVLRRKLTKQVSNSPVHSKCRITIQAPFYSKLACN